MVFIGFCSLIVRFFFVLVHITPHPTPRGLLLHVTCVWCWRSSSGFSIMFGVGSQDLASHFCMALACLDSGLHVVADHWLLLQVARAWFERWRLGFFLLFINNFFVCTVHGSSVVALCLHWDCIWSLARGVFMLSLEN